MLNNVKGIFKKAFGIATESASKDMARQRLQVVLVQDRFSLPAQTLNNLKDDLVNIISKYLDIEKDSIEVEVQHTAGTVVLVTNIPVAGPKRVMDSDINTTSKILESS